MTIKREYPFKRGNCIIDDNGEIGYVECDYTSAHWSPTGELLDYHTAIYYRCDQPSHGSKRIVSLGEITRVSEFKIDLEAIEARCKAATDSPWEIRTLPDVEIPGVFGGNSCSYGEYYNPPSLEDAEFISHAREDIPALLAEITRLNTIVRKGSHCG